MGQLNNIRRLTFEQFKPEDRQLIDQVSEILNPFMEDVINTVNGDIDINNSVNQYKIIEVTVDSHGVPLTGGQFTANITARGSKVTSVVNLTSPSSLLVGSPFVVFVANQSAGYTIKQITGLIANDRYQIIMELNP